MSGLAAGGARVIKLEATTQDALSEHAYALQADTCLCPVRGLVPSYSQFRVRPHYFNPFWGCQ